MTTAIEAWDAGQKRTCDLTTCDRPHFGLGLCQMHYQRVRRNGTVDESLPARAERTVGVRWLHQVEFGSALSCWLWLGNKNRHGYGMMSDGNGATVYAHRVAYELFVGPIPEGLEIDHLCNVRGCVNPLHLEPVTRTENNKRRWQRAKAVSA